MIRPYWINTFNVIPNQLIMIKELNQSSPVIVQSSTAKQFHTTSDELLNSPNFQIGSCMHVKQREL